LSAACDLDEKKIPKRPYYVSTNIYIVVADNMCNKIHEYTPKRGLLLQSLSHVAQECELLRVPQTFLWRYRTKASVMRTDNMIQNYWDFKKAAQLEK